MNIKPYIYSIGLIFSSAVIYTALTAYSNSTHVGGTPNIVFILADDLDASISEYWERADEMAGISGNCDPSAVTLEMGCDPLQNTRALIKDQGVTFKNAFVTTALCCSSRSSIEAGEYAHNTGVITNGGDVGGYEAFVKYGNPEKSIAKSLQNAGYRTAIIGKYLNGIEDALSEGHLPVGWDDLYLFSGGDYYLGYNYEMFEKGQDETCDEQHACKKTYADAPSDYATTVVADKAVKFIEEVAPLGEAFYLYVAPTAPHLPLPPHPDHANHPYKNAVITSDLWPSYKEEDISDKSLWLKVSQENRAEVIDSFNNTDYRDRQGSLYELDRLIKRIVDALREQNLLDNTYIVFAGDNGYNLGAHYLIHKMSPYEESIHVPLIIRGPGIEAATINENLVLGFDLTATFAEIGHATGGSYDGASLLAIANQKKATTWRNDFLNEYMVGGSANGLGEELPPGLFWLLGQDVPSYRAVRSEDFSYIKWYEGKDLVSWDAEKKQLVWNIDDIEPIGKELYFLNTDPYQLNNLLTTEHGRIDCHAMTEIMSERLEMLSACRGADCHANFTYPDDIQDCIRHAK